MQQGGAVPGMAPLQPQVGTWIYPVRAGLHQAVLAGQQVGSANGIDGDFMAQASVHAAYVAAGDPPTCPGGSHHDMRGRSRIVAMKVETGSGPFLGVGQRSRIVVNQSLSRAVVYLHGETREWVPGPNFCDDRLYVQAGGGRGMLRMDYQTTAHVAPLTFMAFPRPGEVDLSDLQDACQTMQGLALDAYQSMNRRWGFIGHSFNGPIDWSVITPVPNGYSNGREASFGEGLFTLGDVVQAAGQATDAIGTGLELSRIFAAAPTLAAGASGLAQWAVIQGANHLMGTAIGDPVDMMMEMARMGNAAYQNSGVPSADAVANHAAMTVTHGGGQLHGINTDYVVHTMLSACEGLTPQNLPTGSAAGFFSWPGGSVPLSGRGLAPGEPAATATAPVGVTSMADALAMARAMGAANVPDQAQLQAMMPAGMSLDTLPAPMAGRAGGGGSLASNAPEWTVNYVVNLVMTGERIATLWFDPRR